MSLPAVTDAVNGVLHNGKKSKGRSFTIIPNTSRSLKVWTTTAKNIINNLTKLPPNRRVTRKGRPYEIRTTQIFKGPSGIKYTLSSAPLHSKKK